MIDFGTCEVDDADLEAFRGHLRLQVREAAIGGRLSPQRVDDAVTVVATLWNHELRRLPAPDTLFHLLTARVLQSMGELGAARGALRRGVENPLAATVLERLLAADRPSLTTCRWIATGVARPVESALASGRNAWRLDADRLLGRAVDVLPLAVYQRLLQAVGQLAELWDPTGGHGVLFLRGRFGRSADGDLAACWKDAPRRCRDKFRNLAAARGWRSVPGVCHAAPGA